MANGFAKPSGTDTKSSPCYDGLFNNVSTPLLELKDHPWPKGTNDFVNHRKIKKYIQSVADSIDLAAYTCFHTKVLRIRKSSGKWHVLSGTLKPSRLGDPQYAESIRVCHHLNKPFSYPNKLGIRRSCCGIWPLSCLQCARDPRTRRMESSLASTCTALKELQTTSRL